MTIEKLTPSIFVRERKRLLVQQRMLFGKRVQLNNLLRSIKQELDGLDKTIIFKDD